MKRFKHTDKKRPTERVSFYIALSICMMAVGFAVWSAYSAMNDTEEQGGSTYFSSLSTENAQAAQDMTGVTVAETHAPTAATTAVPTQAPTQEAKETDRRPVISETMAHEAEDTSQEVESDGLKAVLKVSESLVYPVKSRRVTKPYSEDAVYSKTLRDRRAHTGCDFYAEEGESVYAMCGGIVNEISVSELYGVIIEVDCGGFSIYYCGLDTDFPVSKDDELSSGDTVGAVGTIPCEKEDGSHVHIEIRAGGKLIDPLSVIESDG